MLTQLTHKAPKHPGGYHTHIIVFCVRNGRAEKSKVAKYLQLRGARLMAFSSTFILRKSFTIDRSFLSSRLKYGSKITATSTRGKPRRRPCPIRIPAHRWGLSLVTSRKLLHNCSGFEPKWQMFQVFVIVLRSALYSVWTLQLWVVLFKNLKRWWNSKLSYFVTSGLSLEKLLPTDEN